MALSDCVVQIDARGRETTPHGTAGFPVACYHDNLEEMDVPWHWHEELEAAVVESGTCILLGAAEERLLQSGEVFLVSGGALHACTSRGMPCRLHSIVFSPALIGSKGSIFHERFIRPILDARWVRTMALTREMDWMQAAAGYIENAWQAMAKENGTYELTVRDCLSRLCALWSAHLPPQQHGEAAADARWEQRVKEMLTFIHEHYGDEITVGEIAGSASVSESECLRCFRRVLGTAPIRVLQQYRLERAEELLTQTDMPISRIGETCGFREMSYFSRTFREQYGMPPTRYREAHQ